MTPYDVVQRWTLVNTVKRRVHHQHKPHLMLQTRERRSAGYHSVITLDQQRRAPICTVCHV